MLVKKSALVTGVGAAAQETGSPRERAYRLRASAYWICTLLVAFEMAAGGIWDLLRIEYVRVVLIHLGYPLYLLFIIGVWKIPCALTLVVPRFARLKEWAYAGAFFNYTGAAASHLFARDGADKWGVPLALAVFTLSSWALRPASRRLASPEPATDKRAMTWIVPILIVLVMLVVSFLTVPKGPLPH